MCTCTILAVPKHSFKGSIAIWITAMHSGAVAIQIASVPVFNEDEFSTALLHEQQLAYNDLKVVDSHTPSKWNTARKGI